MHFVGLCYTIKNLFVCAERHQNWILDARSIARVLPDTLLISVNSSVGELIGKLGFLKPHCTCRVINYICSLLRAVTYWWLQTRADQSTAYGEIFLARGINRCPQFFFYLVCPSSISILCTLCVYTHPYLTANRLYMYYRCYQITLEWNIFIQFGSSAKCWLDIYRWGAGLAVAGRICDIGQNVLQSYFQT